MRMIYTYIYSERVSPRINRIVNISNNYNNDNIDLCKHYPGYHFFVLKRENTTITHQIIKKKKY